MAKHGLFQRLVLAGTIALGFATVWGVFSVWAVQVGENVAGINTHLKQLLFMPDGTPLILETFGSSSEYNWQDLDGNAVVAPHPFNGGMLTGSLLTWEQSKNTNSSDDSWQERIRSFNEGNGDGTPVEFWYFIADGRPEETGYFVGYERKSRARVGFIGLAGFRTEPLPADERIPFAGTTHGPCSSLLNLQREFSPTAHPTQTSVLVGKGGSIALGDVYVVGADRRIYHVDLQRRTVRVAFDGPHLRSASLFAVAGEPIPSSTYHLAVRTEDSVIVLDENDRPTNRFAIPQSLRDRDLRFAVTAVGEALMYPEHHIDELEKDITHQIAWVSPDGRTREATVTLPLPGRDARTVLYGVQAPSPILIAAYIALGRPEEIRIHRLSISPSADRNRAFREFWPSLAIAALIGVILAALCYRRQVRFGASVPERIIWPIFVFVLGLPGWIGYRFALPWPVAEPCSECGDIVPHDRERCFHCDADFQPPALKGTEVFA